MKSDRVASGGIRVPRGGSKSFSEKLEESTLEWIYDHRERISVSRTMMIKKAKIIYGEMTRNGVEGDSNVDFLPSAGWLRNIKKSNNFSLLRKASIDLFCIFDS